VALELVDGLGAVIDRNEVDQFPVVIDLGSGFLNLGLQIEHLLLFAGLRLEEGFKRGFSKCEFVVFGLVALLLVLDVDERLHNILTALNSILHALCVQELSLHPQVGFLEGVLPAIDGIHNLCLHLTSVRMSQGSRSDVSVTIVINAGVLGLHECIVHPCVVLVGLLSKLFLRLDALLHLVEVNHGLAQERCEVVDELSVLGHLGGVLLFVELEIQAVLLKDQESEWAGS